MNKDDIILVEEFVWMKRIMAKNDGNHYYMIGRVIGKENTLLVSLVGGNGGALMFCQKHDHVYSIKGSCVECLNTVLPKPI